jgi:hypothetical protein
MLSLSAKGRTALLDAIYLSQRDEGAKRQTGFAHHIRRGVAIAGMKATSSDWRGRQMPTALLEYLTHWSTAAELEELTALAALRVTELASGRVFDVQNVNELPDITKIGAELRNQYILVTARAINRMTRGGARSR